MRLRVGLNSGQVIVGEIGSGPGGYTAVGEAVGMAQRMESVDSAGWVMLSESTARLAEAEHMVARLEAALPGDGLIFRDAVLLRLRALPARARGESRIPPAGNPIP